MVAIKSHLATNATASLNFETAAVLFFGTDAGLVAERSHALAKRLASLDAASEILRLTDDDLDQNPDFLALELRTIPMFGGRKIVRATAGRRINATAIASLLDGSPLEGFLIVEAGNLKPDDSLRALFEKHKTVAAVACYADESRDLEAIIREELNAGGLTITPGARQQLASQLGADRALSRREIEKLVLYAQGRKQITEDDVEAIVGDASDLTLDRASEWAASGNGAKAVSECDRAIASGESAQSVIAASQRYFLRLHRLAVDVETGMTFEDAVRRVRPPVHFKQKDLLGRHCRMWPIQRLQVALEAIAKAAKAARFAGTLEDILAARLLLDIAALAGSQPKVRGN